MSAGCSSGGRFCYDLYRFPDTTGEDGEKKEGEEATPAGEQTEEAAAAPEGGDGEKKEGEGEEGAAVTVEAEVQGQLHYHS